MREYFIAVFDNQGAMLAGFRWSGKFEDLGLETVKLADKWKGKASYAEAATVH